MSKSDQIFTTSISDRGLYPKSSEAKVDSSTYSELLGFGSLDEFQDYLSGKKILDIASGVGMFARHVIHEGLDCQVRSLDPIYSHSELVLPIKERAKKAYGLNEEPEWFLEEEREFRKNAISSSSHDLSMLDDNSFDAVFSVCGLGYYELDDSSLKKTFAEIARVLKPSGQARFAPFIQTQLVYQLPIWITEMKLPLKVIAPIIGEEGRSLILKKTYEEVHKELHKRMALET